MTWTSGASGWTAGGLRREPPRGRRRRPPSPPSWSWSHRRGDLRRRAGGEFAGSRRADLEQIGDHRELETKLSWSTKATRSLGVSRSVALDGSASGIISEYPEPRRPASPEVRAMTRPITDCNSLGSRVAPAGDIAQQVLRHGDSACSIRPAQRRSSPTRRASEASLDVVPKKFAGDGWGLAMGTVRPRRPRRPSRNTRASERVGRAVMTTEQRLSLATRLLERRPVCRERAPRRSLDRPRAPDQGRPGGTTVLARSAYALGRLAETEQAASRVVRRRPKDAAMMRLIVRVLQREGRHRDATGWMTRLDELGSDTWDDGPSHGTAA